MLRTLHTIVHDLLMGKFAPCRLLLQPIAVRTFSLRRTGASP